MEMEEEVMNTETGMGEDTPSEPVNPDENPVIGGEDVDLPVDAGMMVEEPIEPNDPNIKYELTETTRVYEGVTLYRIKALADIPSKGVKSGDLGGWVESVDNLDSKGGAWIFNDGIVMEGSFITEDGQVQNTAIVRGNSVVKGYGILYGKGFMEESALLAGRARCNGALTDGAMAAENALILEGASVSGLAFVKGDVRVSGILKGNVTVSGCVVLGREVIVEVPAGSKMEISGNMQIDEAGDLTLKVVGNG